MNFYFTFRKQKTENLLDLTHMINSRISNRAKFDLNWKVDYKENCRLRALIIKYPARHAYVSLRSRIPLTCVKTTATITWWAGFRVELLKRRSNIILNFKKWPSIIPTMPPLKNLFLHFDSMIPNCR